MDIKPITEENIEEAWSLFQALMKEQKTEKFVKIDFTDFKETFFSPQLTMIKGIIGFQDGIPIALATYCYSFTIYRAQPVLTFKTFYVLPKYRRQGHGQKILGFLTEEAEKNNCAYIQWSVYEENQAAISYYDSYGFKPDKELLNYLVTPDDMKQKMGI